MTGLSNRGVVRLTLPEQGEVDVAIAGVGRRLIAALADVVVMGSAGLFVALLIFLSHGSLVQLGSLFIFAGVALLPVLGPFLFELRWHGQTPGKRWMELRVVARDGTRATAGQLFLRNALRVVDFLPFGYCVGLASVFATKYGQRLGDLVAGTLVVREDRWAVADVSVAADVPVQPRELLGVPLALFAGARSLLDRGRDGARVPPVVRARREAEIAALVRQFRPDLRRENDEQIWARLRRDLHRRPDSRW